MAESTGTAPGGGNEVTADIEGMRAIANDLLGSADSLQSGASGTVLNQGFSFNNVGAAPTMFGGIPAALDLGAQHRAAHQVYKETIAAVRAELSTMAEKVRLSAEEYQNSDDAAELAMATLGRELDSAPAPSEETWRESRSQNAQDLDHGDENATVTERAPEQAPMSGDDVRAPMAAGPDDTPAPTSGSDSDGFGSS